MNLYNNLITDWSPVAHIFGTDEVIFWKEKTIENYVRRMLDKLDGDITPSDLDSITELDLSNFNILDSDDIAHFKNLTSLKLNFGSSEYKYESGDGDLSPLSGLTNLTNLSIRGKNLSDLSPLSSLTNLTELEIDNAYSGIGEMGSGFFKDISPLSGLTNLTKLIFNWTSISDLSPLSTLSNLTYLDVSNASTNLNDISVLSGLINLTYLDLSGYNRITDWSPVEHVAEVIGRPE